jgi:hypothetical protein
VKPSSASIRLFEANQDKWSTYGSKVARFIQQISVEEKVIGYIKDKGIDLGAMITSLKVIVSCENFGLEELFQSTFFGHPMLKANLYGTIDEKVLISLHDIFFNMLKQIFKSA